MDPRELVRVLILKRLVESIPNERVEKNLPALEKVASKITDDVGAMISLLIGGNESNAPKQCKIRGLNHA